MRLAACSLGLLLYLALPAAARAQAAPEQAPAPRPTHVVPYPGDPGGQGWEPPAGTGPDAAWMLYETGKRSHGLALLIEFLVPGGGSIYGDHIAGALTTWGVMVGGFAIAVWGLSQFAGSSDGGRSNDVGVTVFFGGAIVMLCGRIYGFADAWSSTTDYNAELARKLGLPPLSLGLTPMPGPRSTAWGPSLTLRF